MSLVEHDTNHLSQATIGAAIEVHRHLGPGLLESSYQACLGRELELRGLHYEREVVLPLEYKGERLAKCYVIDLVVGGRLLVEVKAVERLLPIHTAQLITYLRLKGLSAGLLVNFHVEQLVRGVRRVLL